MVELSNQKKETHNTNKTTPTTRHAKECLIPYHNRYHFRTFGQCLNRKTNILEGLKPWDPSSEYIISKLFQLVLHQKRHHLTKCRSTNLILACSSEYIRHWNSTVLINRSNRINRFPTRLTKPHSQTIKVEHKPSTTRSNLFTSKAPADTAEVAKRLQKTRNSEYLKSSFFSP